MAKSGRKKKEDLQIISDGDETSKIIDDDDILPIIRENLQMEEVDFTKKSLISMSDQAIKWEKYIGLYKMTPEQFLDKYPNHVNKKFIEEIIEFRKNER